MKLNERVLVLCCLASLDSVIFCFPVTGNNEETSQPIGDFDRNLITTSSESTDTAMLASSYFIARKEYERAIAILEKRAKEFPNNDEYRVALCKAHIQFGDNLIKRNDEKNAVCEYQNALLIDKTNSEANEKLKKLRH
jgi:tetratricopeptide (TPR) repeat protein